MSYSSLIKVYRTKNSCFKDYENGHGSGSCLWSYFSDNYFPNKKHWLFLLEDREFWSAAHNKDIPEHLRAVFSFCLDGAVIHKKDLELFGNFMLKTFRDIKRHNSNNVNHWADIGNDVLNIAKKQDIRLIGVGLNCTSVSDLWSSLKPDRMFNAADYLYEKTQN